MCALVTGVQTCALPIYIGEVNDRLQEIRYSSRTRMVTEQMRARRKMQRMLQAVLDKVPAEIREQDPTCQRAAQSASSKRCNIIHLIYRHKPYEQHRSEERRVGKEWVSTWKYRWSPEH